MCIRDRPKCMITLTIFLISCTECPTRKTKDEFRIEADQIRFYVTPAEKSRYLWFRVDGIDVPVCKYQADWRILCRESSKCWTANTGLSISYKLDHSVAHIRISFQLYTSNILSKLNVDNGNECTRRQFWSIWCQHISWKKNKMTSLEDIMSILPPILVRRRTSWHLP